MIDVADCVADLAFRLNFKDGTDLAAAGNWVTVTELYEWADEAVQQLAADAALFVTYDTSITVSSGTALYNLPASHVFLLGAWLAGTGLRLTPVRELEALDGTWSATSGAATRCSVDAGKVGTITLYPKPTAGGTLGLLAQQRPATIDATAHTTQLPGVLQDAITYAMLAGARGKESDAAMLDVAAHAEQRLDLYRQVVRHLYGHGQ